MPNCYTNLNTLKDAGTLGLTTSVNDTQLLRVAEDSSRMIDRYTDRFFYIYEGTFYQDGGSSRVVLDWDVQSITTLYVDTGGDSSYPDFYTVDMNVTTSPDAYAYPFNSLPKTHIEANPFGRYGHLGATFRKALKITGTFGFGNDWPAPYYHALDCTVGSALTSTATSLSVTASTANQVSGGATLKIGSEQVFVTANPTGSTCPIARAQNGTTAGSDIAGVAIYLYDYPQAITQATVIQTIRTWKRRESGYVNSIVNTDMGNIQVFKGLDPDVAETIRLYKRERIMRYIN